MEIGGHGKVPIQGEEMPKHCHEALNNQLYRAEDSVRLPERSSWHSSRGKDLRVGSSPAFLIFPLSIFFYLSTYPIPFSQASAAHPSPHTPSKSYSLECNILTSVPTKGGIVCASNKTASGKWGYSAQADCQNTPHRLIHSGNEE